MYIRTAADVDHGLFGGRAGCSWSAWSRRSATGRCSHVSHLLSLLHRDLSFDLYLRMRRRGSHMQHKTRLEQWQLYYSGHCVFFRSCVTVTESVEIARVRVQYLVSGGAYIARLYCKTAQQLCVVRQVLHLRMAIAARATVCVCVCIYDVY